MKHWLDEIPTIGQVAPGQLLADIARIKALLQGAGVPNNSINYAIAQVMLESNLGRSNISTTLNNYSGIKYINKPYQKATKGSKSPEGDFYAKYTTPNEWANDYRRILALDGPQGPPLAATSVDQYLNRLQANKYFTDPGYKTKYYKTFNTLANAIKVANAGTTVIKYTGGPGSPTKKIETITRDTEAVTYSNDPTGRVDPKTGQNTGLQVFDPNTSTTFKKPFKMPLWGYVLIGLTGVVVVKKIIE
jgi:hypothetical protein